MLAFVDESGDTGRRITNNSSSFLAVAVVIFQSNADAQQCDDAIAQLRANLRLRSNYEFHYAHNSPRVKEAFLRRVSPYRFSYHAFAIDKAPQRMLDSGLQYGNALHRFAILKALEISMSDLDNAIVTLDNGGERKPKDRLTGYLRQNLRSQSASLAIRRIKLQDSAGNNLLQLADYVAGIINRSLQGKRRETNFLQQYLMPHVISRVLWP